MQEQLDRSWLFPETYTGLSNVKMPEPGNNAVVRWNSDGTALISDLSLATATYKVGSSADDEEADYLEEKLKPGTGLSASTVNPGGDEEYTFTIDSTVTTLTGTQTLQNKTLTSPKINEDVAVTATATELNILDGVTSSTAELNIMDGVTASTAELNITDGVTSSTAEINILDGVTSSAAEINILDGVTSTTAELNILDGVTASTAELNIMDGVTSTTAELNILDGVTSTAAEINVLDGIASVDTDISTVSGSDDTLASAKAIKTYVDDNAGGGGAGSIDTLFTLQAKSEDAAYTARGTAYIWSGDTGGSLANATLALETTAGDLIQSEKVFAYDAGGDSSESWWYHEKVIQPGYGGKNMVLQLQYFTRNGADGNSFRFYARDASKPVFTSTSSADGSNTVAGTIAWDASLPSGEEAAATIGDRVVLWDTSNVIHYRYITAVSVTDKTSTGALTITYSGADITAYNSKIMLIGVMSDELDYLPANDMAASTNNEAKVYRKQMQFPDKCTLFQFGFLCTDTDTDIELYYDDIALSANQFLQVSSQSSVVEQALYSNCAIGTDSAYTRVVRYPTKEFDTIEKYGTIENTAAYGWVFTATQPCMINISANVYKDLSTLLWCGILKNGTALSTDIHTTAANSSLSSQVMAMSGDQSTGSVNEWANVSWGGPLVVGDKIRVGVSSPVAAEAALRVSLSVQSLVSSAILLNSQDEIFTDWVDYTPVWSVDGGTYTDNTEPSAFLFKSFKWRRNGSNMEITATIQYNAVGANGTGSVYTLEIPSGYAVDTTQVHASATVDIGSQVGTLLWNTNADMWLDGRVKVYDSTHLAFAWGGGTEQVSYRWVDPSYGFGGSSGLWSLSFQAVVPIQGWNSSFNPVLSMPLVEIGNNIEEYSVGGWTGNYNYRSYTTNTPNINTISGLGTVRGGTSSQSWRFTASQSVKVTATAWYNYTTARWIGLMAGSASSNVADSTIAVHESSMLSVRKTAALVENSNDINSITASFLMEPGDIFEPSGDANTVTGTLDGGFSMTVEKNFSNTNMAHIIKPAVCILKDIKGTTTDGGTSYADWSDGRRELNTVIGESWFVSGEFNGTFDPIVTGSNPGTDNCHFVLEKGHYELEWTTPMLRGDSCMSRLYNVTDSAVQTYGQQFYSGSGDWVGVNSKGDTVFTITTSTTFRIESYVETVQSSIGLGYQSRAGGGDSVYTQVKIRKLK
jgi:hypothetical protein